MKIKRLIRILEDIPETKLLIFDLAWKLTRPDGTIDQDKSLEMVEEIEAASQQVEIYSNGVSEMNRCLRKLVH